MNAEEELCQVVEHPPGEGVVVLTPGILQIIVSLVVEHLIGGQIHSSIQQLKYFLRLILVFFGHPVLTVKPDKSQPRPQKMRASMRPMM